MNQKEFEYLVSLYRDLEKMIPFLKSNLMADQVKGYALAEQTTKTLRRRIIKGLKNEF